MRAPLIREGDVIAGKYRVDRVLGAGGMGVVVAATHRDLGEKRAIKLMHREALANMEAVERFEREARAATRLKSDHVAKVYEVGRLKDASPYMVMEHLDGTDLRELLRERGALPVSLAVDYVLQACEAVAEAHARGIIHRDLKPANLFLVRRPGEPDCVKVLDFGISKITSESGSEQTVTVTKTHAVLGSPHYMSPEQMRSSRDVDLRTDIWSLGVISYLLLSGRQPFEGESITEIITEVIQATPAPLAGAVAGVTPALDAIILHCLEKEAALRCPDVGALAAALAPFASPAGAKSVAVIQRFHARATVPSTSDGVASQRAPVSVAPVSVAPLSARVATEPKPPEATAPSGANARGAKASGMRFTPLQIALVLLILTLLGVDALTRRRFGATPSGPTAPASAATVPR